MGGEPTITTKAFPLKKRPYRLDTNPTAKALNPPMSIQRHNKMNGTYPTAALISLWFGNLVPTKWFVTQPIDAIAISRNYVRKLAPIHVAKRDYSPIISFQVLTISLFHHGAISLMLRNSEYIGTVKNAHHRLGVCCHHGPAGS